MPRFVFKRWCVLTLNKSRIFIFVCFLIHFITAINHHYLEQWSNPIPLFSIRLYFSRLQLICGGVLVLQGLAYILQQFFMEGEGKGGIILISCFICIYDSHHQGCESRNWNKTISFRKTQTRVFFRLHTLVFAKAVLIAVVVVVVVFFQLNY